MVLLTKFHDNSSKIVDFLLIVIFLFFPGFFGAVFIRLYPMSTGSKITGSGNLKCKEASEKHPFYYKDTSKTFFWQF